MARRIAIWAAAVLACIPLLAVAPASAQVSPAPTWQDTPHKYHERLNQILKDMTQIMGQMTEEMTREDLTAERQQRMAQQMANMSAMMQRISGLVARPALKEADWEKLMDEMRKQTDAMLHDSRMAPAAR